MKRNVILFLIAVCMVPFVVISFSKKKVETNFILEENNIENIILKVKVKGEVLKLNLEDYIVGVVAGEMPASFEIEALKAQAVASRSYALYKKSLNNPVFDLTDDTNTQVFLPLDEMKIKWGDDYEKYYKRIKNAVEETKGEVLTYNENIIEAFYFSMSNGNTQDAKSVFGEDKEYLKRVESIYDTNELKNFAFTKAFELDEFKSILALECETISIENVSYNDSHYVNNIKICNKNFSGVQVRNLLNLRSSDFVIEIDDDVLITTYGYGHGVGMSQYGANGYAKNGYSYKEILIHYYENTEIKNINNV